MAQRQTEKSAGKAGKKLNLAAKKPASDKEKISAERQNKLDSALLFAIVTRDRPMIMRLIKAGADIKAKNTAGETVLHLAAFNGSTETCILVMEEYAKAGGNVKKLIAARDKKGRTALHWPAAMGVTHLGPLFKSVEWLEEMTGNAFMKPFAECVKT